MQVMAQLKYQDVLIRVRGPYDLPAKRNQPRSMRLLELPEIKYRVLPRGCRYHLESLCQGMGDGMLVLR